MCGKMAEELLSLKWNNHQAHFVDILTFLREQEIFVDATLACGGKLYAAHKFVLSTCSDYFKQMFTKNPSKHPIVFMKDVSTRDLEALLDFMYNGEVNVPQSSLGSLIKTAEGLQIKGLAVPDDPPAKRDRDKRDNKPPERLSPPPKRSRVRENSPVHSLPSRSLAQSSYTPTPSSSINRPRSPLPPTNTSSGVSQAPIEGTLDEDSRTSIQSGVSGLSEQNSSTTPSLSSKIGSSSQQIQSNTGDINSHLEQSGTEEPSPGPSGIQKQEIKQEDIVDLGEDDEGDWGAEGDAGGGDSSMGSENPPSFPDVILPHGSDAMHGHTGDPAMTMRLILGELGEAGGGASTLLPEGSGDGSSNNIPLARRGTVSASSSATGDVQHSHTAPDYDILEYCLSDSMTDQLPGEHPRSPPRGLHHSSSSTGRLQGAQTSGDHQLVTGALLYQSRPYACPYCAKRFKRKDHLVEHERTHTGERPYVCRECGKSFAKKTNLNTHVRSHHIQRQHHVQPGPLDLKSNSISP